MFLPRYYFCQFCTHKVQWLFCISSFIIFLWVSSVSMSNWHDSHNSWACWWSDGHTISVQMWSSTVDSLFKKHTLNFWCFCSYQYSIFSSACSSVSFLKPVWTSHEVTGLRPNVTKLKKKPKHTETIKLWDNWIRTFLDRNIAESCLVML